MTNIEIRQINEAFCFNLNVFKFEPNGGSLTVANTQKTYETVDNAISSMCLTFCYFSTFW